MGKCVLNFDQIEIVNQKSDSNHSDNDWFIVTWFVDDKVIRTDKFPLYSLHGGLGLQSGDGITPFSSEVECSDASIATVAYVVMNLGSTDGTQQADAAAQIAENVSEKLTQAYLEAVQLYIKYFSDIPFSDLLSDQVSNFAPEIVQSVGAAFEDVVIPLLNDLVNEIQVILRDPNCNGPVFYDTAVYRPDQPIPDASSSTTYTASSVTGCGFPAKTNVSRTLHRELDVAPSFPNTPSPQVFFVPSESKSDWISPAVEDSSSSHPIVMVTIAPSLDVRAGSGLYTVSVKEQVDPRFDAVFEASAINVRVSTIRVVSFVGNTPGTVRSWISRPLRPTELTATALGIGAASSVAAGAGKSKTRVSSGAGGRTATLEAQAESAVKTPPRYAFTLGWQNSVPVSSSSTTPIQFSSLPSGINSRNVVSDFFDTVNVLQLPAQGVTLCLYEYQLADHERISYGIRYIRAENLSYTRADWALVSWSPVG
ncbi:hypothetical protein [Acidicapsa acidisoli]|uniref:hypothetical protein n=1 Tax=Acidicapsa acidisoli TaxID=1615681 RepID=UPI0021E03BB5|nr:hypothetical protein [Acidicapsa acidisoli]